MGDSPIKRCGECEFWRGSSKHIGYCTLYKKFVWEFGNCMSVRDNLSQIFKEIEKKQQKVDEIRTELLNLFESLPFSEESNKPGLLQVLYSALQSTIHFECDVVKILSYFGTAKQTGLTEYVLVEFREPTVLATQTDLFFFQEGQRCAFVICRQPNGGIDTANSRVVSDMAIFSDVPEGFKLVKAEEIYPSVFRVRVEKVVEDESLG